MSQAIQNMLLGSKTQVISLRYIRLISKINDGFYFVDQFSNRSEYSSSQVLGFGSGSGWGFEYCFDSATDFDFGSGPGSGSVWPADLFPCLLMYSMTKSVAIISTTMHKIMAQVKKSASTCNFGNLSTIACRDIDSCHRRLCGMVELFFRSDVIRGYCSVRCGASEEVSI